MRGLLGLFLLAFCFPAFAKDNPNPIISGASKLDFVKLSPTYKSSSKFSQIFVNHKIITQNEVSDRLKFLIKSGRVKLNSKELKNSWQKILIERMIEEELIRQKAQFYKLQIDRSQIDEYVDNYAKKYFVNFKNFLNFLKNNQLTLESFQNQIEAEIIWQKIIEEVVRPTISVSMIETKEWLEKEKITGQNQKYLLIDYLIGNDSNSGALANSFYQELKFKKDFIKIFEKIVRVNLRNSENIGWLWSFELNIKILDKIKNLKINEFSEPVLLEDGWHIYELRDKKTDFNISHNELEYVKNQIIGRKLEMATKNFLNDLKKRAFIRFE